MKCSVSNQNVSNNPLKHLVSCLDAGYVPCLRFLKLTCSTFIPVSLRMSNYHWSEDCVQFRNHGSPCHWLTITPSVAWQPLKRDIKLKASNEFLIAFQLQSKMENGAWMENFLLSKKEKKYNRNIYISIYYFTAKFISTTSRTKYLLFPRQVGCIVIIIRRIDDKQ